MDNALLDAAVTYGVPLCYALGLASAVDAVLKTRTPQGASAWALGLILMPFLFLPAYWVFGRSKFAAYRKALEGYHDPLPEATALDRFRVPPSEVDAEADRRTRCELEAFTRLATLPFTRGNALQLLVDGAETFPALFKAFEAAEDYLLVQFYILRDDTLGRRFQQALCAAAGRGVRVYLLYDEVGSHGLPRRYLRVLREAGVEVSGFSGRRSWLGRFRLNFRNHRKIAVIDGHTAFVGGLNVGDEYVGRHPTLTPWRDTHLRLQGPAVLGLQQSFLCDWYYGRRAAPEVSWAPTPHPADQQAMILASGPGDVLETCGLLFTHAIESAERRCWIASPYFVPDGRVLGALQMAALRGVDTRVLMPRQSDNVLFKYVPYASLPEVERAGVEVHLYEDGFMHQKVMLIDDDYAAVSTANLDNRSFRFNFEVTCLARDARFSAEVAAMLEADFARATRLTSDDLHYRDFLFRLATQTTRLLAPVL